jgi:hypothetical protein
MKEYKSELPLNESITTSSLPSSSNIQRESQGIYDQINNYFSEQDQQQKTVQEAREILGESAANLTDEKVYDMVVGMQYLVDTWLEEFEKDVFDGKTLKEITQIDL